MSQDEFHLFLTYSYLFGNKHVKSKLSISQVFLMHWQDHPPQLPAVIHQEVMDYVAGFPVSLEEVKTLWLKLMDERNAFEARHDAKFAEATFNLCEH